MTLQEFIDKYTGKGIDFDGHYGFQCVDLYRQYVQDVLSFPQSPGVAGAKDIWETYLQSHFERIANTPEGMPEPGDIMIWGDKYGQYGHVAVVTKATLTTFTCFSQNDPINTLCGLKTYRTYAPTLGWLHPKTPNNIYRGYDLTNSESMKICVDDHIKVAEGQLVEKSQYEAVKGQLVEAQAQNSALSSDLGSARSELKIALESAKVAKESLERELNDQLDRADQATKEQEEHQITKGQLSSFVWEVEDDLKLGHPSDDMDTRITAVLGALQSLHQRLVSAEKDLKDLGKELKACSEYKNWKKLSFSKRLKLLFS